MPFDPNGAIHWKGRYHLFYIFQNELGHCFGHVSSVDLMHWKHHPTPLVPGDGDEGIFSGNAFLDAHASAHLPIMVCGIFRHMNADESSRSAGASSDHLAVAVYP